MEHPFLKLSIRERRQKWTEALRSGTYQQTSGVLRRTLYEDFTSFIKRAVRRNPLRVGRFGYCCLGVALDVSDLSVWGRSGDWLVPEFLKVKDTSPYVCTTFNADLRDLFGISMEQEGILIHMNDTKKSSFSEVADFIDSLPLEEFTQDSDPGDEDSISPS